MKPAMAAEKRRQSKNRRIRCGGWCNEKEAHSAGRRAAEKPAEQVGSMAEWGKVAQQEGEREKKPQNKAEG